MTRKFERKRRMIVTLAMSLIMIVTFMFAGTGSVWADTASKSWLTGGQCGYKGDQVEWNFYDNGELIISGEGKMGNEDGDFSLPGLGGFGDPAPWFIYITDPDMITKITIGEGITSTGSFAFYKLEKVTTVVLPKTLEEIGFEAFSGMDGLKYVKIPEGVTKMQNGSFTDCHNLETLELPSTLTYLGQIWYTNLKTVSIPGSVRLIVPNLLHGNLIEEIYFNEGTETIGEHITSNDPALKLVSIPRSVTEIDDEAFFDINGEMDLTIEGYKYSAAYDFAKKNGFKFKYIVEDFTDDAEFTASKSKVYTGKAIKPSVKVTYLGHKLKKNTDYTVTYKNNKKIGNAKIIIKGKDAFKGTKTLTFKIKPAKLTDLKLTADTNALNVEYGKVDGGVKYQIYYKVKGTSSWKKTTAKGTEKTIGKLKKGKTYQVKVRAFKKVNGTTYYGAWSSTKTKKVKG